MTDQPLIIGPPSNTWTYIPTSKIWDLSNSSSEKITFPTTEGIAGTSATIDPAKTALIVVDMQNFFLDASCMEHPNGLKAVEATGKVLDWCRDVGIKVIWLNWGLTDDDMSTIPPSVQRGFMRDLIIPPSTRPQIYTGLGSDLGSSKGRILFASTWNAAIYPALTKHISPSDIHVSKNRMSGLWNEEQPLWKTLVEEGTSTLLFTGVNTDQCVLGTLVDAYNAGWNCVLVDDCCGTTTVGGRGVTLWNVASSFGFVTRSDKLVAAKVG
ncbi:isochorismatase [Rhexocercosporidium sp. MPI-PUGE-AT-0058]|nr:isochorismatase [Rhexocercosporidium sp. MPI-PUGE-AT-0058]